MKLKVTRKYHTRPEADKDGRLRRVRYETGDTFDGTERELLVFGDRLEKADAQASAKPEPEPEPKEHDTLESLRQEAEALGIEVDGRWKEARLRDEIAKAKE